MAQHPIIPVILSGGAGERLWPLSRVETPKQFLKFGSDHSLIQETMLRCASSEFDQRPIILCGESQRFLIAEHARAIGVEAEIVLEPMRRDSCAAVAAGCLLALKRSPDAMVLVVPADSYIKEKDKFIRAVASAAREAEEGFLTTFGIEPSFPATGFGYIKLGNILYGNGSYQIEKFVEKPNLIVAESYIQQGYLWNSGSFLFRAASFLAELQIYGHDVFLAVQGAVKGAISDSEFVRLEAEAFAKSPQISIDYCVMEKTQKAAVFKVDYSWSDIGTWDAVQDLLPKDRFGNTIDGLGIIFEGSNNFVHSQGVQTALVGVDNLIVVVSEKEVMITKRGQSGRLKPFLVEFKKHFGLESG